MTVGEVADRMTRFEFEAWKRLYKVEAQERKDRDRAARMRSSRRG
jgi:hypothetical protein